MIAALAGVLTSVVPPPAHASARPLASSAAQSTRAGIDRAGSLLWRDGTATRGEIFVGRVVRVSSPPPSNLVSLSLDADQVSGGATVTGTIRLSLPAPAGGLTVQLRSADPLLAQLPPRVTVPAGSSSASFPVTTRAVPPVAAVILTASLGGVTQTATLVIAPLLPDLSADQIQVVSLPANDIVYDRSSGQIWASVPGSAGRAGNSVVPIDPLTGALGAPIPVGSEPGKLAVSDDGRYLYVALDGASAVRRVDLSTRAAGLQFPLVGDPGSSPYRVVDLRVVPGSPNSVALVRKRTTGSDNTEGIAVYDNGVPRPRFVANQSAIYSLAFGALPSRLYALDGSIYHDGFRQLVLDPAGLTVAGMARDLIRGEGVGIQFDGGRLYASSGPVVDPEALAILGTFPEIPAPSPMATDGARGRVFFLTGEGPAPILRAYDAATFLPLGALPIQGVSGTAGRLIRWGQERSDGGGLAFSTSAGQLFLVRTAMVPAAGPTVTLLPSIVVGGHMAAGQVSIGAPAAAGGQGVTLTSDSPAAAVPASVTVPAGATTVSFPLNTSPVAADISVTIAASAGGITGSARLQLLAPTLLSIEIAPPAVAAGQPAAGTLTLSGPAPVGGVPVALRSSNADVASVPTTVTLPAGAAAGPFPVTTGAVASDTPVQITATAQGATAAVSLLVTSPRLATFTLDRDSAVGGDTVTGTVSLDKPAPPGGVEVSIAATSPDFAVSYLLVPAGRTTATNPLRTPTVPAQRSFLLIASSGSSSKSASLTVLPPAFVSVTLEPAAVTGGDATRGTVTLSGAAPSEGLVVTLASDRPAIATPPAVVVIAAGASSASFSVTTSPVAAPVSVTISATGLGATRLATLRVLPVTITGFSLEINRLPRGRSTRGTITLGAPAPAGGVAVSLSNDQPSAVHLPPSVVVPAGSVSVTFPIDSYRVRRTAIAHLVASAGGSTRVAVLAVLPGDTGRR